ncbi:MAG: RDD family protein [Thiohalomonadales bacterium]
MKGLGKSHGSTLIFAGFWRRVLATLIDSIILLLIFTLLLGPLYANAEFFSIEWLISNGITLLITVTLWVRYQGTPGKLLLGCQVVDAATLQPLDFKRALLRYFGYYVSMLPLLLGFLWIAIDKRKQGFHDKIAKTFVLYQGESEQDDESQKSLSELMAELR